jgi:Predicted membrane protein (DUF2254)
MRPSRVAPELWSSLWLVPLLCLAGGIALSFGTLAVDRRSDYQLVPHSFTGGPAAVQAILSTFATSIVSLTSLVLTVTLVAVQLAMGQFPPHGALSAPGPSQPARHRPGRGHHRSLGSRPRLRLFLWLISLSAGFPAGQVPPCHVLLISGDREPNVVGSSA